MRASLAGVLAALVLGLTAIVRAQDAPVATLQVEREDASEMCPDEAALRDLVAARLGRDPFVDSAPLALSVRIARVESGHRARIETRGADGSVGARELSSARDDCRDLADALALALSLTVDPSSLLRAPPEEPAQPEDPAPEDPAPEDPARPEEPAPQARSSAPQLVLGATLLASYGVAPGVSAALLLAVGVRFDAFSIAIEARGELPTAESSVRGAPYTGAIAACGHIDVVALCGVVGAGAFWGEGVDVLEARSGATPYVTVGARGVVELGLGEVVALRLHGELTAPLVGASLELGGEAAWETPPVGVSLGVGVGARIP